MARIIEHIQSAIGGETAKIAEFLHEPFQDRLCAHGHSGRAAVETVAETCRKHPAAVGLATGFLVDRLLVEEARRHEARAAPETGTVAAATAADAAAAAPPADKRAKRKPKP